MLQYTPEVAFADEHALLLEVSASLMLFKGPRNLCHRINRSLKRLQLAMCVGMAPTAQGAWLLAHPSSPARRRCLRMTTLHHKLDRLSLDTLPAVRPRAEWLRGVGCQNLGALRALPRAALQRRIGTSVLRALDTAYGTLPDVHAWFTPPIQFEQHITLEEHIEHTQAAGVVIDELLAQMSGWMTHRHCSTDHILIIFEHEPTRHTCPPTQLPLRLAAPVWQAAHLRSILKEKLDRLVLEAPVIRISLQTLQTQAMPSTSTTLFPEPGGTATNRLKLLDLLAARLGHEHIKQPASRADHRPEFANCWQSALSLSRTDSVPAPVDANRPFWLLEPPLALRTQQDKPYYRTPLTLVKGPERIETGWWDSPLTMRDYFVAQDRNFVHYWIYRERDNGEARWFLHGLFA